MKITEQELLGFVKWDKNELVPVIVQDHNSKDILMMAWMNYDSLLLSLQTKQATYWSRSRKCLWHNHSQFASNGLNPQIPVHLLGLQALDRKGPRL